MTKSDAAMLLDCIAVPDDDAFADLLAVLDMVPAVPPAEPPLLDAA